MRNGILGGVLDWLKHPFDSKGNALSWVLFVGLVIIAAWMWNTVLLTIQERA